MGGVRKYIYKRIVRLWPHYIFSFVVYVLSFYAKAGTTIPIKKELLHSIPEMFMLQALFSGNMCTNHGAVWYVSVLFISSVVLIVILIKGNRLVAFLVVALFGIVGVFSKYVFGEWSIATYNIYGKLTLLPGLIRGLSEMSVGITVFHIGARIQEVLIKYRRSCITLETLIMLIIIVYTYLKLDMQLIIILGFSVALMISCFVPHLGSGGVNKALYRWSKITYGIYLNHPVFILLFNEHLKWYELLICVTIYSFVTTMVVDWIICTGKEVACWKENNI